MYEKVQMRRLVWMLLAGTWAFLLALGLSLVLSRFQALAQPALEVTAPNLDVQKDVNTSLALPGETLAYTITIHNSGDTSAAVWLTDVLPSELTYVSGSLGANYGTPAPAGGAITWSESVGVDQTARIWFRATVSPEITATVVENTAQVTGTGVLIVASRQTNIAGSLPTSQIRSPDMDAIITQKGVRTISGIAWLGGAIPPYLVEDPVLSVERVDARTYWVKWTEVTSATYYLLHEATQPDFSDYEPTTIQAPATDVPISKGTGEDATYYYRVQALRSGLNPSRWSNVESVVVPWTAASTGFPAAALSTGVAANSLITVQVRIDNGNWHTAMVTATAWGWDWAYAWTLPEENNVQHTIQTQARDAVGNLSAIDTITVTMRNRNYILYMPLTFKRWPPIPDTPTLNAISNPDGDGNYTVGWNTAYLADTYTLEEDDNSAFSSPTIRYTGTGTSWNASSQAPGTYYYRVKASNSWGDSGWSSVQSVPVVPSGYRDDFDAATNWAYKRGDDIVYHANNFRIRYKNSQMYTLFVGKFDFAVASPMVAAPSVPYTIRSRVKVVQNESFDGRTFDIRNGTTFGITFGGNGGTPCPADRTAPKYQGCLSHYYRLMLTYNNSDLTAYRWQLKRINYHDPSDDGKGKGDTLIDGTASSLNVNGWNDLKVEVTSSTIRVYINDHYLGQTSDTRYINDPYFGFFMGAPDIGDTGVKWDWLEVEK